MVPEPSAEFCQSKVILLQESSTVPLYLTQSTHPVVSPLLFNKNKVTVFPVEKPITFNLSL